LREFGHALQLPDWYGTNLDALHDCLTDSEWQPAAPLILLVRGLEILRHNDPEALTGLVEALRSAGEVRAAQGHPLWILLATPVRGVAHLPGA
jgi:RNAse (barnase) inhibitor barstar